jgi:uncharacterized RDD family membrane protein YckC
MDQVSIVTPEGITLDMPLAGAGSRFIAAVIDTTLQLLTLLGLFILTRLAPDSGVVAALFVALAFAVFTAYDILFETLASGRTPGKRWTGLRVVTVAGGPIRFTTSAVRNLLRLVDILPGSYLVGIVTIILSKKNQRLGDMAAGTLVVRERTTVSSGPWSTGLPAADDADLDGWDPTALTADEVATVRRFLERRTTLTQEARARLGAELAGRLRPKVAAPVENLSDERFLELAVAAKLRRDV